MLPPHSSDCFLERVHFRKLHGCLAWHCSYGAHNCGRGGAAGPFSFPFKSTTHSRALQRPQSATWVWAPFSTTMSWSLSTTPPLQSSRRSHRHFTPLTSLLWRVYMDPWCTALSASLWLFVNFTWLSVIVKSKFQIGKINNKKNWNWKNKSLKILYGLKCIQAAAVGRLSLGSFNNDGSGRWLALFFFFFLFCVNFSLGTSFFWRRPWLGYEFLLGTTLGGVRLGRYELS